MTLRVAVILPVLNESLRIREAVDSAFAAGADRVLVSDGGSVDDTREIARGAGAEIVTGSSVRGTQSNLGARAAVDCDVICFLHGDSTLPAAAGDAMRAAIQRGRRSGGFLLEFVEPALLLKLGSTLINFRTRVTRTPWGDQAQFYERQTFWSLGGFRPIPIMEDYDLAIRARRAGKPAILPLRVRTSGRRFLEKGVLRTTATNWKIIARYHAGADPERLAADYRRR